MAFYTAIPLKKTYELDLVKPLKTLISSYYSTSDEPIDCDEALVELNKLRNNATQKTLDRHETSLEIMKRYYDQISSLESKCPPQDVQIPFKWKDAFDKGSFFGGSTTLTVSSLVYEKTCILFNIAAMHSQIAVSQASDTIDDDSIKMAAKHFQQASGIFHYLKTCVLVLLNSSDPTPDLQLDTLSALQAFMLAQAQECFFYKAAAGNMKDAIIAKIASQCDELYAEGLKLMQRDSVRSLWDKETLSIVSSKKSLFNALAEYYQSLVNKAAKDIGEELARLGHAQELMKIAESKAGYNFTAKDYVDKINRAQEEAKKDNDFIYHARIPEVKALAPIGKAALAKSIPMPDRLSQNPNDLFSNLLPVAVQQAVQVFDVRKTEIVNLELGKLREQTQILNATLISMNLPAALEDSGGDTLPASLKEKIQEFLEKGGIKSLEKYIEDLPILLERNRDILEEAERLLRDEEESDNNLRAQFREKWTRPTSDKINSSLKDNIGKYRQLLTNATNADQIVRQTFQTHYSTLNLLSQPEHEILRGLPSGSPVAANSCVSRLKQLMSQVEDLKKNRERMEEDFKSCTVDMRAKFLTALSQDGAISEESLSSGTLQDVLGPLQAQAGESIHQQEMCLAEIQRANEEFCGQKNQDSAGKRREDKFKEMATALDSYLDLMFQLDKGAEFYNDLTQLLITFQNKVSDFCFARKTEKDELCKDLQKEIVKQAPNAPQGRPLTGRGPTAPSTTAPPVPVQRTFPPAPSSAPAPSHVPPQAPMPGASPYPPQYPNYPYPYPVPMPQSYNPYAQPVMPHFPQQVPAGYQGMPYPYAPPPNYSYPQYPPQQQQQPPHQ